MPLPVPARSALTVALVLGITVASGLPGLLGASAGVRSMRSSVTSVDPESPPIGATVTWDGTSVGHASTPSDAFVVSPGSSSRVVFTFYEPSDAPTIANASLVLRFLGVTLSTESIAPSPNRSGFVVVGLNWSFGTLYRLTEGVYELDAELVDTHGAVRFLEPFYVDARAPYVVESGIVAFLLVLGGAELYSVIVLLRHRARRRRHDPR